VAILTRRQITQDGNAPNLVPAASGGDEFDADTRTVFVVNNGSGSPINVTLVSQLTAEPGLAPANKVIAVPAGAMREISLNPAKPWINPTTSRASVTYSAVTTVTVEAKRN
jgi:hypothetical protein